MFQSMNDQHAMDFKKSAQGESNIIDVAGTILSQIAITTLSLTDLSQTHWVARAMFAFSLVSSIMSVYATRQYRILGHCFRADEVRSWIRSNEDRNARLPIGMPLVASVLTVLAPDILLSYSLNSFMIGLGVYLEYIWTRNLDEMAGTEGSRAVFITYIVGLAFCYGLYALSGAVVAQEGYVSESEFLNNWGDTLPTHRKGPQAGDSLVSHRKQRSESYTVPTEQTDAKDIAPAPTSRGFTLRSTNRHSVFSNERARQELLQVFQEAARLRKESAQVDARLVQILET